MTQGPGSGSELRTHLCSGPSEDLSERPGIGVCRHRVDRVRQGETGEFMLSEMAFSSFLQLDVGAISCLQATSFIPHNVQCSRRIRHFREHSAQYLQTSR